MDESREATEALLAEKPALAEDLRSILAVDAERDAWSFDDVSLDAGSFGEIVSRGIVERTGEEYRLADPAAVSAALDSEEAGRASVTPVAIGRIGRWLDASIQSASSMIDRRVTALLSLVLALVVALRIVPYSAVFRGTDVVLSGNDPYAYRYVVESMVVSADGPFDAAVLSALPGEMATNEPLMVAILWWVSEVFGGDVQTVSIVLAWFPVASAVVTAALVYVLATIATNDRRVGLAAASMLAIMPLHVIRTGIGFADHHAFDYPFLVLTALALVLLADRDLRDGRTWLLAGVFGFAVAAQALAWNNAAILLVPVGVYVSVRVISDVRAGNSPLHSGAPVAAGLALAATITALVHLGLGWHTPVVALVPAALFIAVTAVVLTAEGHTRVGGSARQLAVLQGGVGLSVVVLVTLVVPSLGDELVRGIGRLFETEGIVEAAPLFGPHFEWIFGPLYFFGLALPLALIYMGWAAWRTFREHDPAVLILTVYAWYFFVLTSIQIRFAGEFSPFAAVFAGLGFVHLASWVDLARVPTIFSGEDAGRADPQRTVEWPERRTALSTVGLWLGVGLIGILSSAIRHSGLTTEDGAYDAAKWIAADASARDLTYPANYVLSHWGTNRMYNYFVSGESRHYAFAEDHYDTFLEATTEQPWYDQFDGRVGYLVVEEASQPFDDESMYRRLRAYGSRVDDVAGLAHFRARYVDDQEEYLVFEVVPGATVRGTVDEHDSITVRTDVSITGGSFTYERRGTVTAGEYEVTLSQPGTYEIGDHSVTISETMVRNGEQVTVSD